VELQASGGARLAVVARNDSSMKIIPSLRDRDRRNLGGGFEDWGETRGTKRGGLREGRYMDTSRR